MHRNGRRGSNSKARTRFVVGSGPLPFGEHLSAFDDRQTGHHNRARKMPKFDMLIMDSLMISKRAKPIILDNESNVYWKVRLLFWLLFGPHFSDFWRLTESICFYYASRSLWDRANLSWFFIIRLPCISAVMLKCPVCVCRQTSCKLGLTAFRIFSHRTVRPTI